MQEIEQRSNGQWRPSPGSVYPALSQLEDEGLIRATQTDTGRLFEITDAGRGQAEQLSGQKPPWEPDEEQVEPSLATMRNLFISIARAGWQVATDGDPQQIAKACELLAETRRGLYRLLAEDPDPAEAEGSGASGGEQPGAAGGSNEVAQDDPADGESGFGTA
jgi:DNA-binding PadR family transcriptional regulator